MIAAALDWGEFAQQIVLSMLPLLAAWLGHVLGVNGSASRPPPPPGARIVPDPTGTTNP